MPSQRLALAVVVVLLHLAAPAWSHSWVEQLMVIASNGTFTGNPGYVRGQVFRGPTFQDASMTNLIPPNGRPTGNEVLATDLMCHPSQTTRNYSSEFPMLLASPGDNIALRYQENGHVTQPDLPPGKPSHSGTVYIYGTTQPRADDTFLAIHNVWNAEGTGGDRRGRLLSTRHFDDGQCYQVNTSPISALRQRKFPKLPDALMGINLWCQTDVQIPHEALDNATGNGTYTLYWVWDWPTAPGTIGLAAGKNETYTTCMDVQLHQRGQSASAARIAFIDGQNLNNAAIQSELSSQFDVTGTATNPAYTVSATTAPASSTPASSSLSASADPGPVTVTVTAPGTTAYVTVTKTERSSEGGVYTATSQGESTGGFTLAPSTFSTAPSASSRPSTSSTLSSTISTPLSSSPSLASSDFQPTPPASSPTVTEAATPSGTVTIVSMITPSTTSHVSVPSYSGSFVPPSLRGTNPAASVETNPVTARHAYIRRPRIRGRTVRL